jgi:hypothetical protein
MTDRNSPDIGAEGIAEACLDYLVEDPSRLAEFMTASGIGPDELRAQAGTEALDAGILDWFAHNEAALTGVCDAAGLTPDAVMRAYYRLNPGG